MMNARTTRDADNRTRIVLECSLAEFDTLVTLVMETDYTQPVLGAAVAEQLNSQFAAAETELFESGGTDAAGRRENLR